MATANYKMSPHKLALEKFAIGMVVKPILSEKRIPAIPICEWIFQNASTVHDVFVLATRFKVALCLAWKDAALTQRSLKIMTCYFGDSSCVSCGACAETCPTAAISDRFQSKAVNADKTVRSVCSYCGVGCNLDIHVKGDEILSIRAPWDAEVNQGHTCLKGRYAFRFYNHTDRLRTPLIRKKRCASRKQLG